MTRDGFREGIIADALAGSALTFGGPLLFTGRQELGSTTELHRVLPPGGTVYLLGGERAIEPGVEQQVRDEGFQPVRLAGASRVETALAVADELRRLAPEVDRRVLVARAGGTRAYGSDLWPDSITGGGYAAAARVPVLLTPTDALHPAVEAWLAADAPTRTIVLGGPAAVSDAVLRQLPRATRVAGPTRSETAVAVSRVLWNVPSEGPRRYTIVEGYHHAHWGFGLAAAGLAARAGAPILVVDADADTPATTAAVAGCQEVDLMIVGRVVPDEVVSQLDAADTSTC